MNPAPRTQEHQPCLQPAVGFEGTPFVGWTVYPGGAAMTEGDPILAAIESALRAMSSGATELGRQLLQGLDVDFVLTLRRAKAAAVAGAVGATSTPLEERSSRGSLAVSTRRLIVERDHYTCRLCGMKTLAVDVLRGLSRKPPRLD